MKLKIIGNNEFKNAEINIRKLNNEKLIPYIKLSFWEWVESFQPQDIPPRKESIIELYKIRRIIEVSAISPPNTHGEIVKVQNGINPKYPSVFFNSNIFKIN